MKKSYYLYAFITLALILAAPAISRAEDNGTSGDVSADANVSANVRASTTMPKPPLPALIREKLRSDLDTHVQNLKDNQEYRNTMLEQKMASTSRETLKDVRQEDRREIKRDMRMDIFKIRKESLIRQLNLALNNLKQIRERIVSRIEKAEAGGRDMAEARTALAAADAKITLAGQAIADLAALTPPMASSTASSTVDTTATSTVSLDKPREIGAAAIKAVKDAHQALVRVVVAVAHGMGLKIDDDSSATSTATTTP